MEKLKSAVPDNTEPAAAKFTLIALANFADEAGYCYPGHATLATMIGQTERTVRAHLHALVEAGLVAEGPPAPDEGRNPRAGYVLKAPPERLRPSQVKRAPRPENSSGRQGPRPESNDTTTGKLRHPPLETPRVDDPSGSELHTQARARDDAFEKFWEAYPHPKFDPREEARQVWRTLWGSVEPDAVIAATRAYAESLAERPRSFGMQARNWLAKQRWRDAPVHAERVGKGKGKLAVDGPAVTGLVEPGLAAQFRGACAVLRRLIGDAPFDCWIAPLALVVFDGTRATLEAPSKFHADWVGNNFERPLSTALRCPVTILARPLAFAPAERAGR